MIVGRYVPYSYPDFFFLILIKLFLYKLIPYIIGLSTVPDDSYT